MAKRKISYGEAMSEIEDVLTKIENGEMDVDELIGYVKRVSELIKLCKDKLHKTDEEVQKILDDIE